jgi:hypothetical protein
MAEQRVNGTRIEPRMMILLAPKEAGAAFEMHRDAARGFGRPLEESRSSSATASALHVHESATLATRD